MPAPAAHPPIPQSRYRLTRQADDAVRRMSGALARQGAGAHPIFAFLGALGGLPQPIKELSESLGLDFAAGPVLAGCRITLHAPLQIDRDYTVEAKVAGLERRPSRAYGAADHLHLAVALTEGGTPASEIALHIVFPAPEAQ
ncbi:hypothetical protein LR948_12350 [Roseivivax sp. GX 12232]|uniref:hypothetical protein n=1 Tax=Roseivivax sp. GX 12232 TaxID=2900547 RepID=UPI001E46D3D4|nr:hypothetical protein [Roseivivax sp. GX 12232]MCE0506153.1 hypothetical protein [Roseivivax sp. GX 12232]